MLHNSLTLLKNGEPAAVAQYDRPSGRATIIKRWTALYGAAHVVEENLVDAVLIPKTQKEKTVSIESRVITEKSNFKKGNIYKNGKVSKIVKGSLRSIGHHYK